MFNGEQPYALIDFDAAEPGDRLSALGYAAWHWLDIGNDELAPFLLGTRLAGFFADYGLTSVGDPIAVVLTAQLKVCSRKGAPLDNKEWANDCLKWTTTHRRALQTGFENAWKQRILLFER